MSSKHEALLQKYQKLPNLLEEAVAGLGESDLDLSSGQGWSIRAYVHHTVEGELLWQVNLRVILGLDGAEFPFRWYFQQSQEKWGETWAYEQRAISPSLALFRGSTASLVELMSCLPSNAWEHHGRVIFPGSKEEKSYSVRDIMLMHIRHMDGHCADIRAIRDFHGV